MTAENIADLLALHRDLHVCVNADGRGSTDYEADSDCGLTPCPTYLLVAALADEVQRLTGGTR